MRKKGDITLELIKLNVKSKTSFTTGLVSNFGKAINLSVSQHPYL